MASDTLGNLPRHRRSVKPGSGKQPSLPLHATGTSRLSASSSAEADATFSTGARAGSGAAGAATVIGAGAGFGEAATSGRDTGCAAIGTTGPPHPTKHALAAPTRTRKDPILHRNTRRVPPVNA